ncbi:unnamed protein product [Hymenolepis diminuta]|uniref:Uncharacterized protein n=1 Tax=Hymenolepis diminuta TaxID=6216 RepID=A0A564Z4V9_HYMDI|nr:unnamed protein product [Hymenolepis diminuta]
MATNKTSTKDLLRTVQRGKTSELNHIQFSRRKQNKVQTYTFEPTNAGNLVRGCSVYMLTKSLIPLFIFNRRNQILPGLTSNLPLRTH